MRLEPLGARQPLGGRADARRARPGVMRAMVVRFMKSSTERPEEKRAERAVGSTWFGPPT